MRQFLFVCAALAFVAGGCTSTNNSSAESSANQPQIQEPRQELAGTTWRLVHFQSSDDDIGKIIPPNLEKYTLQFMPDGKLAMQLDCNRGNASWQVADVTSTSGTLTISPVAMTRAMCGPGAIDSRVARDMGFVTSYVIAGGKLHMALKADAGIYVWEPAPPAT
jgi:heat shock protein HslJ